MSVIIDGTAGITFPVVAGGTSAVQASSSKVLQVVNNSTSSNVTSGSGSEATVVTQSITPSSATSKILVLISSTFLDNGASGRDMQVRVKRGSTVLSISSASTYTYYMYIAGGQGQIPFSGNYYDSPATTSSTTYGVYVYGGSGTISMNGCQLTLMEIAA